MAALSALSRFVMDEMRVHPLAELCIKAVDEATIAELNERWMDKQGPTDVLAFQMDELSPGLVNEETEEGVLGDLVLCPDIAAKPADHAEHPGEAGLERPTVDGALQLLDYYLRAPYAHTENVRLTQDDPQP